MRKKKDFTKQLVDAPACPFCGKYSPMLTNPIAVAGSVVTYYIECGSCGAEGPPSKTQDGAFSGWERRA